MISHGPVYKVVQLMNAQAQGLYTYSSLFTIAADTNRDITRFAKQKAVLSQGEPRDAAVNFDTYRAVALPQHCFLVQGGPKSKPAYFCNNFVYCQPIFVFKMLKLHTVR